jgi:hypothetical protein
MTWRDISLKGMRIREWEKAYAGISDAVCVANSHGDVNEKDQNSELKGDSERSAN